VALIAVVIAVPIGRRNESAAAIKTANISLVKSLDFGLNYFMFQNKNTTLCFPVNVFLWNTVLLDIINKDYQCILLKNTV